MSDNGCLDNTSTSLLNSQEIFRVLHIDDDEDVQMFLKTFVEGDKYISVTQVQDAEKAIHLIQTGVFDCFLSDYDMPGIDGITLAIKIREISNIPIIIYTGRGSEEIAERAFAAGIDDYIRKETSPAHYELVKKRIRQAVERRRSTEQYKNLFNSVGEMIFIRDLDGKILDVNKEGCNKLGYTTEELIGSDFCKIISVKKSIYQKNMKEINEKGRIVFESNQISKGGEKIPVDVNATRIKYRGSEAILSCCRDISDRKRLEAQMNERLNALQNHAIELNKCDDINAVAKTTYKILHEVMDYNFFGLGIVDGEVLRFIPDTLNNSDWDLEYPLDGPGICGQVVKSGSSRLVNDVRLENNYLGPKSGYKYLSEVVVPIKIKGKVIAVINVEDENADRLTNDDVRLLEIFAEHVGTSIYRIDLINKTQQHLSKIEKINQHATIIVNLQSLEEIAQYSLNIIGEQLEFFESSIGIVEDNFLNFKYSKYNNNKEAVILSLTGKGISVRAVKTGETQLVDDTRLDSSYVQPTDEVYLSELDVPVKVDGKVVAVINLEDKRAEYFNENDKELIEILAKSVASAILRIEQSEKIYESEQRFKYFLDSAPEGITVNVYGKIVYVNQHFADMMGYTIKELLQKSVLDLTKDDYKELTTIYGKKRQSGENITNQYEVELIRKDGSFIPVEYFISRIKLNDTYGSLTFIRDISYKRNERSLQKKLLSLREVINSLNESQNINDLANASIDILHTILNCEVLSLRLLVGNDLVLKANWDKGSVWQEKCPIVGKGITAKAAREKRTILAPDTRVNPDFIKGKCDSLSELAVPILFGDELLGIINAESTSLNAFDNDCVVLVEAFSAEVGSAISRIRAQEFTQTIVQLSLRS